LLKDLASSSGAGQTTRDCEKSLKISDDREHVES
jgi:hypothetical protein